MSFLGDHGESLYKSGRVLTQYGFAGNIIVSFLGDHGESLNKSGRVLTQYGFADNIIVSFLGDHGKSLYKPGLVLTQYGLLTKSWCPFWETTVRVYISQRVLTQYGFADDTIVSFLGDHGDNVYKSGRVLAQYSFAAGNTICPFWETTVRT